MLSDPAQITIRPVENADSPDIIDLIARCFADYPNVLLDVDAEEPHLRTPADSFERFWVAVASEQVVGTIACGVHESADGERAVELKKLYIDHRCRGAGLARRLVTLVEDFARERDIEVIDLWSDTKFDKAHAVYEHFGWARQRRIRDLHDISDTREYYFVKRLDR